jgi:hypothetical protein
MTEAEARKLHATIATALDGAFRGGGTLKTSPSKVTITVEHEGVKMTFQQVELASLLRGIYQGLCDARRAAPTVDGEDIAEGIGNTIGRGQTDA